ncbi:MAG: hypothetical protein K0R68_437 [Mycobacterium sp.]|jgi:hypothetical protein|nr:hypothetical protein [Mycobacterium sp.]
MDDNPSSTVTHRRRPAVRAVMAGAVLIAANSLATGLAGSAHADPAVLALPACYGAETLPAERPAQAIFQFCADAGKQLTDLRWSDWGPGGANGTGTYSYRVCEPNCAAGSTVSLPVVVHADEPGPASSSSGCPEGVSFYANLVIAYRDGVPDRAAGPTNTQFRGMPATLYSTVGSDGSETWLGNVFCAV